MIPLGPYVNEAGWTPGKWFIVSDYDQVNKMVFYIIVKNGQDRREGTPCPTLRDVKAWMKDNGFTLVTHGKKEDE
jgi:hypothetical protein